MDIASVLGMELSLAKERLEQAGYTVKETELRSRKGLKGDAARVIRVCARGDGGVELCWSLFKTDVRFAAE